MIDDPSIDTAASALERGTGLHQWQNREGARRLISLGTGDSLNGERTQASLAVPLSDDETMLIDASSGTVLLGRLEAAGIPLGSVRHLFLSHRHFDHVGGLLLC
jgi:glyoxylase-like metal-dependent hydrolase (beta-lactamase superfamily II)